MAFWNGLIRAMIIPLAGSLCWLMGIVPLQAGEADSRPSTSRPLNPSVGKIREAIEALSHPRPTQRQAAARQLAGWGPVVVPELRRAAADTDLETALLARALSADLEQALFFGAEIRLRAEPPQARWNEEIRFLVEVHNPSAAPIRVPWPAPASPTATQPYVSDAEQVGAMLDIADFLRVIDPDGQDVLPRFESIDRDPKVSRAVRMRAAGALSGHELAAGDTAVLVIPAFNRGWMRYPLLAAGRYTLQLTYQPSWREKEWEREGLGFVRSPPLVVEITEAAPEIVRRSSVELVMAVNRNRDAVEAVLTNAWDRPLWINLNIGAEWLTHAKLQWIWHPAGEDYDDDQVLRLNLDETGAEFAATRVRFLESGQSLVLSRPGAERLREPIGQRSASSGQLSVRYMNLADGAKTSEMLAEIGQKVEVPTHLFSGSAQSEPVIIPESE